MFSYTSFAHQVMSDMVESLREFRHIDPTAVGIVATSRAASHPTGNVAYCYGLGRVSSPIFCLWTKTGTRNIIAVSDWYIQKTPTLSFYGHELKYLILVRMPRMLLNHPLETLVHELYHIHPKFDGSMRRTRHGSSFDGAVEHLVAKWIALRQGSELAQIAKMSFTELERVFGAILVQSMKKTYQHCLHESVDLPPPTLEDIKKRFPELTLKAMPQIRLRKLSKTPILTEKDLVWKHCHAYGLSSVPTTFARSFLPHFKDLFGRSFPMS